MKYLTIILVFIQINYSFSQFEISPAVGYMLNGKLQFEQGHIDIDNSISAGVSFSARIRRSMDLQLDYTYGSRTNLNFYPSYNSNYDAGSAKISSHYITLNTINYFIDEGLLRPYSTLGAGTAIFDIQDVNTVYIDLLPLLVSV